MRLALPFAAACLAALTACDMLDFADSQRFTEDFRYEYPLRAGGRLSVENQNGSIEIAGWTEERVEISGTKYANSEEALAEVKIDVASTPDSVTVRTVRPAARRTSAGARYVIRVPRSTILERVVSTNGHIRAEDLEKGARLRTTNGAVRAYHVSGGVEAITQNGTIEIDGVEGAVVAKTTNGRVRAERLRGAIDARSTNGSISIEVDKPEARQPIRVETTNGSVNLRLSELNGNEIQATTTNGSLTVRLPESVGAKLQARASRSKVETEFEVKTTGVSDKHRLEGVIGAGGPLLDLETSNGTIRLLKL